MLSRQIVLAIALAAAPAVSQQSSAPVRHPLDAFPLRTDGPVLRQRVQAGEPFTVAGTQGLLVGQQQGTMEAWVLPVKLLSHLTIEANVEGYDVPIAIPAEPTQPKASQSSAPATSRASPP